ncbi:MAG: hypothetical protein M0R74_08925 [Dehalococcoidia bacterium]|nr:hypothetical protein [Dehalococcoidia bacterium]
MRQHKEGCQDGSHQYVAVATSGGAYLVCKACEQRVPAPAPGAQNTAR